MDELVIERLFSVPPQASLKLSNLRGHVSIQPGLEGEMAVRAAIDPDSGDLECMFPEIEQEADGSVRVTIRYDDRLPSWNKHKPCRVAYTVSVPPECDLKIKTVSSSIEVQGVHGEMNLESVSGKLELSDLSGDLRLKTVSGDINGQRLDGALMLDTVSGDASLKASSLPEVNAKVVSGDIYLETPVSPQPYRFSSVSGDVRLASPAPFPHRVRMQTFSGKLRDARSASEKQAGGEAPASIIFNSLSGNLSLEIREFAAP